MEENIYPSGISEEQYNKHMQTYQYYETDNILNEISRAYQPQHSDIFDNAEKLVRQNNYNTALEILLENLQNPQSIIGDIAFLYVTGHSDCGAEFCPRVSLAQLIQEKVSRYYIKNLLYEEFASSAVAAGI